MSKFTFVVRVDESAVLMRNKQQGLEALGFIPFRNGALVTGYNTVEYDLSLLALGEQALLFLFGYVDITVRVDYMSGGYGQWVIRVTNNGRCEIDARRDFGITGGSDNDPLYPLGQGVGSALAAAPAIVIGAVAVLIFILLVK